MNDYKFVLDDITTGLSPSACVTAEPMDADTPVETAVITDKEAESLLPGYAIAFEEYHLHRAGGDSPDTALQKTLDDWRSLWGAQAYVPHRRRA